MGDIFLPQCVAAFWEVDKRIIYHTRIGEMLQGLHYDKEGTFKIEGEDTLPLLQPWGMSSNESTAKAYAGMSVQDLGHGNSPVSDVVTVAFRISTSRKFGLFRRIPADNTDSQKGLLEWVASIKDAVETSVDRVVDSRLNTAAWTPVRFSVGNSSLSQLCYSVFLEITVDSPPMDRAQRMSTLVEK